MEGGPRPGAGGTEVAAQKPLLGRTCTQPLAQKLLGPCRSAVSGDGGGVSFFKETLAGTGLGSTRRGSPHARPTCLPPPSRKDQAVRAWDPCPKADPNLTGGGLRSRLRS